MAHSPPSLHEHEQQPTGILLPCSRPGPQGAPPLRRLLLVLGLALALGLGGLVGGFALLRELEATSLQGILGGARQAGTILTDPPGTLAFAGRDRLNILCLGIDYNYTSDGILYTKNARSDTIFVLSLEPGGRALSVLSIPRDTRVFIAAAECYDKINAAYSYGGAREARATVGEFLGIPIDYHVLVKVKGAGELVDAVGGLEVDVEKAMDYDDNWGNLHIHLKKGRQVLDGRSAVGYCRFRMDEEGDRGRIRRQQQVMEALLARLSEPEILPRLPSIVDTIRANVETDLSFAQMLDLANLYHRFDRRKMRTGAVEGEDVLLDEVFYIQPFVEETRALVERLIPRRPRAILPFETGASPAPEGSPGAEISPDEGTASSEPADRLVLGPLLPEPLPRVEVLEVLPAPAIADGAEDRRRFQDQYRQAPSRTR